MSRPERLDHSYTRALCFGDYYCLKFLEVKMRCSANVRRAV